MPSIQPAGEDMQGPISANIDTVIRLEKEYLDERTVMQRVADRIGEWVGSIAFLVIHLLWFSLWFLINTGHVPAVRAFDPYPFIFLSMTVSVEAVLLSTFVLIKQNRSSMRAEQRAHLNLQIALLTEREMTAAIRILSALSQHFQLDPSSSAPEVQQMTKVTEIDRLMHELRRRLPDEAA
jgi:uncharacterized membrane protein